MKVGIDRLGKVIIGRSTALGKLALLKRHRHHFQTAKIIALPERAQVNSLQLQAVPKTAVSQWSPRFVTFYEVPIDEDADDIRSVLWGDVERHKVGIDWKINDAISSNENECALMLMLFNPPQKLRITLRYTVDKQPLVLRGTRTKIRTIPMPRYVEE